MRELKAVLADPVHNADPRLFRRLAQVLREDSERKRLAFVERAEPAPYQIWGEGLEAGAVDQIQQAARLPVAVAGALMPDAHLGYGLPIGGVLATENAVIPYAVGVDIACRMRLSVFDIPARTSSGSTTNSSARCSTRRCSAPGRRSRSRSSTR